MAVALGYDVTAFLTTFACSLLVCLVVFKWFKERNYPPGPWGLPVLGYALFLGKKPHLKLRELGKKYGDIFSFTVGPKLHISVTDYQLAKELLTHPATIFRPPHSFDFMTGRGGMGGYNGDEWHEQRRFSISTMRNLGLGKGLWETMIQEGAADFVEEIRSWKGKPYSIDDPLTYAQSSNNIALLIGRHFDKENKSDRDNLELVRVSLRRLMEYFSSVGVNISLPWLSKIIETLHLGGYPEFLRLLRGFENIFKKEVEMRMKSPESLTKDDFIGCYLREMENKEKEGKPHYFTMENLIGNLSILFMAGNDANLAGISWLLLIMAGHPDIQKRIHDEIDAAAGMDGVIYYDLKNKMPYTMATIHEMTRFASISPIFPPRAPLETFTFNGYTIPKGCHIVVNMYAIMRDPRYFKDPDQIKPERFLDKDGKKILKLDGHAPFSIGKRNCPGEGVAIMSIFLYFVHIMQKFKVTVPPGAELDYEPTGGGALLPKPQKLCFIER